MEHLHVTLAEREEFARGDYEEALRQAFHITNEDFMPPPYGRNKHGVGDMSGTTAVVTLVIGDTLYVANAGDSRAVISRVSGGERVGTAITTDHKPEDEKEFVRIKAAGGAPSPQISILPWTSQASASQAFASQAFASHGAAYLPISGRGG